MKNLWIYDLLIILSVAGWFWEKNISILFSIVFLILAGAKKSPVFGRLLELKLLRLFGKYCYSIYLFHTLMIHLASNVLRRYPLPETLDPHVEFAIHLIVVSALSLGLGVLSYEVFEKRFINLGRMLVWDKKKAPV